MSLNFDLGGKTYPSVTRTITADEIAVYADASRDRNPRHQPGDDQIGSPIFPVVYGLPMVMATAADPDIGVDNPLGILHGEHRIVHHRPIRPGDTLTATAAITQMDDKGKHATYTVEVTTVDGDGEPVSTQTDVLFVRGGGSGTDKPKTVKPEPHERGEPVATFTQHVDETMPKEYAEASGDRNPIHLDASVAEMVGLPGVINHGLGTLSLVVGGIVEHAFDGDPTRATEIAVRFTDFVIPGSDLTTQVWEDGSFDTTRPDGTVVQSGRVS